MARVCGNLTSGNLIDMQTFCPAKARFLQVSRPVNTSSDGGGSLLSDHENPRWWSAILPSSLSNPCDCDGTGMVGMTVGKLFSN